MSKRTNRLLRQPAVLVVLLGLVPHRALCQTEGATSTEVSQADSDMPIAPGVLGQPSPPALPLTPKGLSLQACLRMAEINYPKIVEAMARLGVAEAQEREANIAPYTDFSATGGILAAPTVRGTNVFSRDTDAALRGDMGLAWQLGFSGTVPLWTFGKISNLQAAAENQVAVKRHELRQSRDDVALQVRRAFYGLLFARDTAILLDEVQKHINKSLTRLSEAVEEEEADEVALLKLRMYDAELRARRSELCASKPSR